MNKDLKYKYLVNILRKSHLMVIFIPLFISSCGDKQPNSITNEFNNDSLVTIANPVLPGDFADPSVVRVGDVYWATATSSEWAPLFPLLKSNDLQRLKRGKGHCA